MGRTRTGWVVLAIAVVWPAALSRVVALALAAMISATWVADAGAARIDWGPTLSVTADPGEGDHIRVQRTVGVHSPTALAFINDGGGFPDGGDLTFSDSVHCRIGNAPNFVFCDFSDAELGIAVTALSFSLGDHKDSLQLDDDDQLPASVTLGTGDDSLSIRAENNSKVGQNTVDAGPGFDDVAVSTAADTIDGGADNDSIFTAFPAFQGAQITGGTGFDSVSLGGSTSGVTVAIGSDGIGADVEGLSGSRFVDRLTGNGAANSLFGADGDDVLEGGGGDDQLDGGNGSDRLEGQDGDDQLGGNDGVADQINCGAGIDRTVTDVLDAVNADCELPNVEITSAPPPLPATTDSRNATFVFSGPANREGTHECRVVPADFAACTSPVTFTSLAPGARTFEVRFTPTGGAPRAVVSAEWTINPRATITSGPSSLTRERTATFVFERPADGRAGHLECRFDSTSAGFSTCTSPMTFENLQDGPHRFELRFVPNGGDPDTALDTGWEVDGTQPVTQLVSGPSGTGNGPDATIVFESANDDVERFECQLDAGPATICNSPHQLTGLAPGAHHFAVSAVDRAGNVESPPAELFWEVAGAEPPITFQCATATATAGLLVAIAREEAACWTPERVEGRPALASEGVVSANGIQIDPGPGTRIIVAPELNGGALRTTGPVTLSIRGIPWQVDEPLVWNSLIASQVAQIPKLFELVQQEIGGLPMTVAPSVELSADNGGQAKFALKVVLPKAFKTAPGTAPAGTPAAATGFTVDYALTTSNDKGVTHSGKITIAEAWLFGRVKVKDLSLGGDTATNTFEGTVTMELAQPGRLPSKAISKDAGITFAVSLAPADVIEPDRTPLGAVRKLSAQVSKFEKHLGEGFYLQRFGAELATGLDAKSKPAVVMSANVGLSFGPRLQFDSIFEGELLALDGVGVLTIPMDDTSLAPVTFEVKGEGKLVDIPVTNVTLKLETTPRVSFTARQGIDLGGFGIEYGISDAFFDVRSFTYNARGKGRIRIPFLGQADMEVVQSSSGIAGCAQLGEDIRFGFGKRWVDPAVPLSLFGNSCDVGPFSVSPARTAQAGGEREVMVEQGRALLALELRGTDGAPRVTLSGPGGVTLTSPLRRDGVLLVEDAETATTHVLVEDPAAGRWTVSSDGIAGMRTASERPPVKVSAKLAKGRLRWTLRPQPGQRVTFTERGAHTARSILSTSAARGSVRFTPAISSDRVRRIEALVTQDGVPRAQLVVARFTARPAVAGRVRAIRRVKAGVVGWKGTAPSYAVAVRYRDGKVVTATVRKRVLRVKRRGPVNVTVVPLAATGKPGRAVAKRLKL